MKIIFIHGMNQQAYDANSLKQHWLTAFQSGLSNLHLDIDLNSLDISLPFYGDLLSKHHLYNSLDLQTFLPKSIAHLHLPFHLVGHNTCIDQENKPCITSLPTFNPNHSETLTQRLSVISALTKDHAFRELSMFLNHYPKLHETVIHKFLIETYLYLSNPDFMQEVHRRIMCHIIPDEDHLIVAHSLGSVITYNLLHQFTNFRIQRFITLGSPLAFKVIQAKLPLPICRPPQLHGDWFNFYSLNDFLTAFPLSEAPFNFEPPIINQAIVTLINNPHSIMGYLEHPAVIKSIMDTLKCKK
ncbi:hypothetical protein E0H80_01225 [Acinetobacter sp. ANC 4779]|uniref:hypothetical protein n=1 Tax=Acinetobacter sp. ANC 4779 TaxID=2529848 RepID=UPI001039C88E|nr:hypothetical protein [Acinetobacter sp. ANC 4779]TCB52507.1 hypothetical protein E0H80_01225 [Acinetobacter sp. ANC 4779]